MNLHRCCPTSLHVKTRRWMNKDRTKSYVPGYPAAAQIHPDGRQQLSDRNGKQPRGTRQFTRKSGYPEAHALFRRISSGGWISACAPGGGAGGGGGGGSEVTVDGFAAGPCQTSTREIDWLTVFRANPRRKCTVSLLNPKENIAQRLDTLGIQRCHPIKDRQCNQNIFFQKSEVRDVRGFGVG